MRHRPKRPARAAATAVLLVAASGCAHRAHPALASEPIAPGREWVSPLRRDHPLVGRIWEVRSARFVDEAALEAALAKGAFALLGETHDNADHHLIQARLVRAITSAGRRPALAFEMLDVDQQPAIDAALARAPRDPDALAAAVAWDESGWPEFALYRPIVAAGLEAGLPIVAANLRRDASREIVMRGRSALPASIREQLSLDEPLAESVERDLRQEMRDSHCGALPEDILDPMVLAQRARNVQLAERMLAPDEGRGAVLVTGSGHARTDRAVPVYLRREAPDRSVVSVALLEVLDGVLAPQDYAREFEVPSMPFDFVVFTPAAEREDPCRKLRETPPSPPLPATITVRAG